MIIIKKTIFDGIGLIFTRIFEYFTVFVWNFSDKEQKIIECVLKIKYLIRQI